MNVEHIARICHEANRAYCETIGDRSQTSWSLAEKWQRDSAIAGVQSAIKNPTVTPSDMHINWCEDKIAAGWLYGPIKDAEKKTHPCLVPYEHLPEEQRHKDALFLAIVRALAESD